MRPATGCFMRPAVLPTALITLLARKLPAWRLAERRSRERSRTCLWFRASAVSSVLASSLRSPRAGWRGSNISMRTMVRTAWISPPAPSVSPPILLYRRCGSAWTTSSAAAASIRKSLPKVPMRSISGQTTVVEAYAPPFTSPYIGQKSLTPNQGRETWDATLGLGVKLWRGAEFWFDPSIDQGFGLSATQGVAGFPTATAFRVGASVPYPRLQKYFVRQTIDLGGDTQKVDVGLNQFAGSQTADRLVITIGKFAVTDLFDTNKYANNPRRDFMNLALINAATFDSATDAWGYTYGAAAEWYQGDWTLRGGLFDLSVVPNSTELDQSFAQFQWLGEIERRYELWGHPGKVAVTGFLSRGPLRSRVCNGIGPTTRSAWPASSTAFPKCTRNFSMTGVWAFSLVTAGCRIPAPNRLLRCITSYPFSPRR